MMDDVSLQLKRIQESTPEKFKSAEELILKMVNIAFGVGCDVYEGLINGE